MGNYFWDVFISSINILWESSIIFPEFTFVLTSWSLHLVLLFTFMFINFQSFKFTVINTDYHPSWYRPYTTCSGSKLSLLNLWIYLDIWQDSLDEGSVQCKASTYTGQHNTSVPWVGLKFAIPVFKQLKTVRALDRMATGTGKILIIMCIIYLMLQSIWWYYKEIQLW
jgi:hypothetical protein